MAHRVVLIPGDGTGPELTEATRRVIEATGQGTPDAEESGTSAKSQLRNGSSRRSPT